MKKILLFSALCLFVVVSGPVHAKKSKPIYDADATPDVIFGSGIANGGFTVVQQDGIEVALRVKTRFDDFNLPLNDSLLLSNGDGSYSVDAGAACPGFGWNPNCLTTAGWSFEWSINTDVDGTTGMKLSDFVYELGMDADPGKKGDFTVFDPISPSLLAPLWDHATGDNGTGNGGGTKALDPLDYVTLLTTKNVAGNSWHYEFFNNLGTSLEHFDPSVDGVYEIYLEVIDPTKGKKGKTVARVEIEVIVGNP